MVDRTPYLDKEHTPEQAVRNIFGRQHAPKEVCLLFASFRLLTYARIAMLGKDEDAVRKSFTAIIGGEEKLGADPSEIELNWLTVTAIWLACRSLVTAMSTRQAKMLDDPSIVPALPSDDHVDFRARFSQAHVDMVLVEGREPHPKFTERVNRDLAVLGSIPFYEIGEIRTRSETIAQKSGLAESAEHLLKMSKQDETRSSVGSEEEAMERLHAFFVALEHLNHCEFSVKDGPMIYIKELTKFRGLTPGLPCLLFADKLIRKEVARLTSDERDVFPCFSSGLLHVLTNCRYLWDSARTEASILRLDQSRLTSPKKGLSLFNQDFEPDKERDRSSKPKPVTKSSMKREKQKARLTKALGAGAPASGAPKGGATKKGQGKGKGASGKKPHKVPEKEWTALMSMRPPGGPRCPFWNSSHGCQFGEECKKAHICMECGGNHTWCSQHM